MKILRVRVSWLDVGYRAWLVPSMTGTRHCRHRVGYPALTLFEGQRLWFTHGEIDRTEDCENPLTADHVTRDPS